MDKKDVKEMLGKQMQLLSERSEILSKNDSEGLVKLTEAMCSAAIAICQADSPSR